ncbi:MAG: sulfatase [Myxococcota bacterium]
MRILTWLPALVALLAGCGPGPETAPSGPPRADVLLVTLDTLRADHLGVHGAGADATPALDAWAQDAVVFERALAASSRTAPSHATLFTSRWVAGHAIGYRNGATRLANEATLAALLAAAGYETAAFVSNAMLRRRVGLDAGFAHYDDVLPDSETNRPVFERVAGKTTRRAIAWLERPRRGPVPRFLWVHYNDPHGPYTPPERWVRPPAGEPETPLPLLAQQRGLGGIPAYQAFGDEREARQYRARYAGEIRYLDGSLGRLLAAAEEQAGAAGVVVAITADHGESLGEDGIWFSHGHGTAPNLAHVPLLLRADGLPATRVREPVHHVDLLPTLLEQVGLPVPPGARGVALGPVVRGEATLPADRPLYVDVGAEVSVYRGDVFLRARFGKNVGAVAEGSREAFRWSDGASWQPLADDALRAELSALAEAYDAERETLRFADAPSDQDESRLRALGYLEPLPAGD